MSIFDYINSELPGFPLPGAYQAYLDIADSYGDFYRIDPDGRLWRLTVGACMDRAWPQTPHRLGTYTDPALEIYGDGPGLPAYLLTFDRGLLTCWRTNARA